jgi:hypothetical protein
MQGGKDMLRDCIAYSSNLRYDIDWRRWATYVYQCWEFCSEDDLFMQHLPKRDQLGMLIGYGHYCLTGHRKNKPLAASTISGSFSGIRHSFRSNLLDTDVFDHKSLRAFKTSTAITERKNLDYNKVSKRKFPMTVDMVENIVVGARGSKSVDRIMCATAIQLAFFCLLRVSEYVPNLKTVKHECCHAMLAKDVLFELTLPSGKTAMMDATRVTADMWQYVTLVKFTLRSMKNDQLRIGSTFWFRNLPDEPGMNIVKATFEWALIAQLQEDDFFFSHRRCNKSQGSIWLTYTTVNRTIKECAKRFQLNPRNFGTHSPRIGGACTLRAGEAPDTMLKLLGKWRGDTSSWVYQETSTKELDRMQRIIRNPNLFTLKDIHLSYARTKRLAHSFAH